MYDTVSQNTMYFCPGIVLAMRDVEVSTIELFTFWHEYRILRM